MDIQSILYLALILVAYIFTKQFLHKLQNRPPSPILNLPIYNWPSLPPKETPFRSLAKIADSYGPILYLYFGSRQVLVVSSPSSAEECLSKNDITFANRPNLLFRKHIGYNYTSLVWSSYGDHYKNLRKISVLEIFSSHRLQLLQAIRVDEVKAMLHRVYKASQAAQNHVVDMKTMLFEMMLNIMMRMIAGKRYFGDDDKVEDAEQARLFREIVVESFEVDGATNMGDFLPVFLGNIGSGGLENRLIRLQQKRDVFIQELIDESRSNIDSGHGGRDDSELAGKKKSMIEVLLTLREKEPEYYTDAMIKSLMLVLLTAGTDTTAGTIEWALSILINNPKILKKAQNEINDRIGQERLIDESDVANLPYLRCIMNEMMRMFLPGPLLLPRNSSEECKIGGYNIPQDTMLLENVWAIHHDPKIWEEPERFKPERFEGLEGTRDGYKFMPFGSGMRSCPGEGLMSCMVGLTLGSLLQCFDWERVGEELVDMSEGTGLTLPKAQPLMAKCRPRQILVKLFSQI